MKQQLLVTRWSTTNFATCSNSIINIELFRERLSEKMCTRQPQKVLRDMINTLFLTTVAGEPTLVAFHLHLRTYVRGLSCHSFKFLWRTGQTKPPTISFGIVACPFSDNLSRNSCIPCPVCLAPPFSKYVIPSSPYLFSIPPFPPPPPPKPIGHVLLQNKTISHSSSFLKT